MVFGERQARTTGGAVLLVLIALWAFAAVTVARDAADLLRQRTLGEQLGQPTDAVITALQDERRGAVRFLAADGADPSELTRLRERTDEAADRMTRLARGRDVRLAASDAVRGSADDLIGRLGRLPEARAEVDGRRVGRATAAERYTEVIDAAFLVYGAAWTRREADLAADSRAFVALLRAREQFAREDTLAAGALATGRLTAAEQLRFVELRATQRMLFAEAAAQLPAADRERYRAVAEGPAAGALRAVEDRVAATGSTGAPPAGEATAWQAAADPVLTAQRTLISDGVRASVDRATPTAIWTIVRLGLFGGLGLVAVLAAVAVWRRARRQAGSVAAEPAAVAEVQAPDPAGQPDLFLVLEQRNQVLVRRQLDLLEAMQRRETGVDELADLFSADHLATRLRRNVEKAITLAGSDPGRRWRRPVPLLDVARAAAAEIEEYQRVTVGPVADAYLAGPAVTDTMHLLAELIENAAWCSPPEEPVILTGEPFGEGYAIEVRDAGAGLDDEQVALLNDLIHNPGEAPPSAQRQGLHVVGRLAERQGLEVQLYPAPEGGTTARVLIPPHLLADEPAPQARAEPPWDGSETEYQAAYDEAAFDGAGYDGAAEYEEGYEFDPATDPSVGPDSPAGLPTRVPQPRRPLGAAVDDDEEPLRQPPIARRGRAPEDVRRRLDSYRAATLRGRGELADAETAEIPVNWVDPARREER